MAGRRRRKPLLYDTAANDDQRPVPIRAPCPNFASSPCPRHALWYCGANEYPIPICSPAEHFGGTAGGKIAVLCDGFDAKAWGEAWKRDLSFKAGINLDDAPLPPLKNLTLEQAYFTKNYDENTQHADRDPPWDLPHPPMRPWRRPRPSLGLAADGRACAGGDRGQRHGAITFDALGKRSGAPTSSILARRSTRCCRTPSRAC